MPDVTSNEQSDVRGTEHRLPPTLSGGGDLVAYIQVFPLFSPVLYLMCSMLIVLKPHAGIYIPWTIHLRCNIVSKTVTVTSQLPTCYRLLAQITLPPTQKLHYCS